MPATARGVPVATMAIGGARNAGLMAVRILSVGDATLAARLAEDQLALEQYALAQDDELNPS